MPCRFPVNVIPVVQHGYPSDGFLPVLRINVFYLGDEPVSQVLSLPSLLFLSFLKHN